MEDPEDTLFINARVEITTTALETIVENTGENHARAHRKMGMPLLLCL